MFFRPFPVRFGIDEELPFLHQVVRAPLGRPLAADGVDSHPPVKVEFGAEGLLGRHEDILHPFGARFRGAGARVPAYFVEGHARGDGEILGRDVPQDVLHHVVPDGAGPAHAGHVLHGSVVRVAHPHADDHIRGVADGPVVHEIVGRPRLHRRGAVQLQGVMGAERGEPRPIVAEDAGDLVDESGVHGADRTGGRAQAGGPAHRGRMGLRTAGVDLRVVHEDFEEFAAHVAHAEEGGRGHVFPPVGQGGVRVRHLQEGDFAAPQGEGKAVIVPGQGGDAHAAGHILEAFDADVLQRVDRGDVVGVGEGRAHGDKAVFFAVVVPRHVWPVGVGEFRFDVGKEGGRVPSPGGQNGGGKRLHGLGGEGRHLERGQVGEGFDGRARLPRDEGHVDLAVDVGVVVVQTAHHGQDLPRVGPQDDDGRVVDVVPLEPGNVGSGNGFDLLLQVQVQGGVHLKAPAVDQFRPVALFQLLAHVEDEVGRFEGDVGRNQLPRFGERGVCLLPGDVPVLDHEVEDDLLAGFGALGVGVGVVVGGRLDEPCQQAGLGQGEFLGRFPEEDPSRGLRAVRGPPEVHPVEVHLQDGILVVAAVDLRRQDDLLHLALEGALR